MTNGRDRNTNQTEELQGKQGPARKVTQETGGVISRAPGGDVMGRIDEAKKANFTVRLQILHGRVASRDLVPTIKIVPIQ